MFPAYIRSVDDALAYLDDWARAIGGERVNGIVAVETLDGTTRLRRFDVELTRGRVLTVSMTVNPDLTPITYRFNLARGGVFTWRLDLHPGHEAEHGGPSHLHVGPSRNYRIAHPVVGLVDVAERVHRTLRSEL